MNSFAKKFAVVALAIATIGSFVPVTTQAQTTAELQAQIQSLLTMIAQLQAQLAGSSSGSASHTYTVDLTLGSKGTDVTALQQFLVSKGFLSMPAGVDYGYFGNLTKAALASYQASVGISPAVGYFGPITRAHFNSMVVVTPVTPAPGVSTMPSTGPASGIEGILTVETNPTPSSGQKYYEGDSNVGLLGLKVKALNSEINVQRVKVDLGTNATAYTRVLSNLSIWDGSTMLQSIALNSGSVTKENSHYYVYFTFNDRVEKDQTKVFTIKGDIMPSVGSTYRTHLTVQVPDQGVRGVDGAGLQQESSGAVPSSARAITVSASLSETAELTISKNSNSPAAQNLVSDSQGDITEATVLVLDVESQDDLIKIDQLGFDFQTGGTGGADITGAYLYDGGTLIQSISVSATGTATFTDMEDNLQIAKDTTKQLTLKVSYANATSTITTSTVEVVDALAYNSEGVTITSQSVDGLSDTMTIISAGPVISFQSGSTSYQGGVADVSSSSAKGTIVLNVKAEGENLYFANEGAGVASSSAYEMLSVYDAATDKGVVESATGTTVVEFSSAFQNMGGGLYKLSKGQSGTVTITGTVLSSKVTGTNINFRLEGLNWGLNSGILENTTLDTDDYKTTPYVNLP